MILKHFLENSLNFKQKPLSVLGASFVNKTYVPIDLSVTNNALSKVDVASCLKLEKFVNNHISANKANVAYGGYLEVRNIYKRSTYFNSLAEAERNIHLGMDLWCKDGTSIHSPLEGTVHSFKNNKNHGDYGPTIILKHTISGVEFYTLYGHLSLDSIKNLEVGKFVERGEKIANLGDATVNGDYPPHLHFQIIKDIQNFVGDYPGVCSRANLDFYSNNCPDPNLLLCLSESI